MCTCRTLTGVQSQLIPTLFFDSSNFSHHRLSASTTHSSTTAAYATGIPRRVHAFLRVQHFGRRMLFTRFVNRAVQAVLRSRPEGRQQARDSGHSPFRGPARGRSPRARISNFAPSQHAGRKPGANPSSSAQRLLRRFQPQPLRDLGAESDVEVGLADPQAVLNAGEFARDRGDRAQHARPFGDPQAPRSHCRPSPDPQQQACSRLAERLPYGDVALFADMTFKIDRRPRLVAFWRQAKMRPDRARSSKAMGIINANLE
jgi:hypothetical protein